MAKFYLGQRVRIVAAEHRPQFVGKEARVTGPLRPIRCVMTGNVAECYTIHIDGIGDFDHATQARLNAEPWKLEPILPSGAAPSEFSTLSELLGSLGAEVKA